jgi:TLC domain
MEVAVKIIETGKMALGIGMSDRIMMVHHITTVFLLGASFWLNYTTIGFIILAITNMSNLFFDAFKYGRMSDDPMLRWITTALFWSVFYISRVQTLGETVLWPLLTAIHAFNPLHYNVFIPLLSGLYLMQLGWFYKLTGILIKNTIRLYKEYRKQTEKDIQEDFQQLISHLCLNQRESSIKAHLKSHPMDSNEASPASPHSPHSQASQASNTTTPAIKDSNEAYMEEALERWRECISRQLDYLKDIKQS